MIVRMKKLTLLCMASETNATLEALRSLGVLHVASVKPPAGMELDHARTRLACVDKTLGILSADVAASKETRPGTTGEVVVEQANTLMERQKDLDAELERLRHEAAKIGPLGDFEPKAVRELIENGVSLRLYHALPKAGLVAPPGTVLEVLSRDKGGVRFVVVGRSGAAGDIPPDWERIELPELSLTEARKRVSAMEQEMETIDAGMKSLAEHRRLVERLLLRTRQEVDFFEVSSGMGAAGTISYLQGFCPKEDVERIRTAAAAHGWGMLVQDPGPADSVPTLLRHPIWVKPIKAVLDTIKILPGYREVDISVVFLLFFSVFFAMIVGDAGYGLLFLVATLIARYRMKGAPGYPFVLLGILSVCTIIWGILTGNYFGISSIPAPLKALNIEWLKDNNHVMELCFLIGAIHLTVAHLWNAVRIINTPQAIAQVGWILVTWMMFLAARYFVCNVPFPLPWGLVLGGTGLVAVILFMTPIKRLKSEVVHHAMLPLTVISNFIDVVSYVRLFAVGMASLQVAQRFNSMAMGLGFSRLWAAPIAALILLAGHSLNIVLSALGILVHGVRLNTLEFSSHIGLEWAGLKYDPFRTRDIDPS